MARVWQQVRRVAPYFRTALLTGERGTGVEAVAQALHVLSPLRDEPFTALPPSDAEVRLATVSMKQLAAGTYYFPEVDCLSPAAQLGLLRMLRVRRPQQVSVIASASTELRPLVSAGGFSAELASALSALQLAVPPLRDRREDIPTLAAAVLEVENKRREEAREMPPELFERLAKEAWPGNLPQMQSVIRLVLERFPAGSEMAEEDLEKLIASTLPKVEAEAEPVPLLKLDQVVHEHIRAVLLRCNGNKLRAAEVLGISRSTLYRMLDANAVNGGLSIAS